ncbi:MAG: hypothetical protein JWP74_665 [Marmoricola sp.]|nr:hypothetical protein [Marmoricola sp.]
MNTRAAALIGALLVPVVASCGVAVPDDASVKAFCSSGEKFSAATTFEQGVKAAKGLQKVGTPAGINHAARSGFVELVDRVLAAKDGTDFIRRSKKISSAEQDHLAALNAYIQKTCGNTAGGGS